MNTNFNVTLPEELLTLLKEVCYGHEHCTLSHFMRQAVVNHLEKLGYSKATIKRAAMHANTVARYKPRADMTGRAA